MRVSLKAQDSRKAAPLAVHRDQGADPLQPVGVGSGRELAALVGVLDLWRAEAVDGLVESPNAEVRKQRVRYPSC